MSGGSKSSSSQATTNTDNRAVADNGAMAVTGSSGVTINTLDAGAIKGALEFAADANHGTNQTVHEVLQLAANTIDNGQKSLTTTTQTLSTAYQDAKGGTVQAMNIATIAVIGAALVGFARK